MGEMQAENVVLVATALYIPTYPKEQRDRIWTVVRFVEYIKMVEGK